MTTETDRPITIRTGIQENLRRLHAAQKRGGGVPAYTRFINRRLARGVAATSATLGLTPNAVTALSALLSAVGLAVLLMAGPHWWSAMLAATLLAAGYVFDSADGQVARLTGASSPAGEWMDHVVDAARTPAIHLTVAVMVMIHRDDLAWLAIVALCFAVLSAAQFMSQILAEQLLRNAHQEVVSGSDLRKSFVLLPTDTGILCWAFALWMLPPLFGLAYTALFIAGAVHAVASMRRKYLALAAI